MRITFCTIERNIMAKTRDVKWFSVVTASATDSAAEFQRLKIETQSQNFPTHGNITASGSTAELRPQRLRLRFNR